MSDDLVDDRPLVLRAEDQPTQQPRAIRAQIVALDGEILRHQDTVARLFDFMPGGGAGRRLLRSLHGELEETHRHLQGLLHAVERGG